MCHCQQAMSRLCISSSSNGTCGSKNFWALTTSTTAETASCLQSEWLQDQHIMPCHCAVLCVVCSACCKLKTWVYSCLKPRGCRFQSCLLTWHIASHVCLPCHISFVVQGCCRSFWCWISVFHTGPTWWTSLAPAGLEAKRCQVDWYEAVSMVEAT